MKFKDLKLIEVHPNEWDRKPFEAFFCDDLEEEFYFSRIATIVDFKMFQGWITKGGAGVTHAYPVTLNRNPEFKR